MKPAGVSLSLITALALSSVTSASPPDEHVSGLLHQPLGDITTFSVTERRLTACCLGSSGEDGVEVQLHSVHGGGASVDITPMLGATGLQREIRIRPKGWDGKVKTHMRITSDPDGHITEEYDFSTIGATSCTFHLMTGDGSVLAAGEVAGPVIAWGLEVPDTGVACNKEYSFAPPSTAGRSAEQGFFDRVVTVTGLTPAPVTGVQMIKVTPVQPCAGCPNGPDWDDVQSIEITGDGMQDLVVADAHLRTFGVHSWGLGQAHLNEMCGTNGDCDDTDPTLVADNLGSSGQDGVAIDLGLGGGGGGAGGMLRSKRCPDCPPGHVTLMKAFDDAQQELARFTDSSNPGTGQGALTPDFSAQGGTEFDVAYIGTAGTALAVERCANLTTLEVPNPDEACSAGSNRNWFFEGSGVIARRFCNPSGTLALPSGAGVSGVIEMRFALPYATRNGARLVTITSPHPQPIVIEEVTAVQPVYASGLPHFPLGDVSSLSVQGRKLTACCLGSSGEDGVELRLDSLHGGGAAVNITPLLGATGTQREIRIRPKGWDGTIKGHLRITSDPGGNVTEEYDFSTIGVTSFLWRARATDRSVLAEGSVPGPVISWGLDIPNTGGECNKIYDFPPSTAARGANQGFFDRVVSVTGLTPAPITGVQSIEITPVQPCAGCPGGPPWDDLQSVEFTAEGLPEIVVGAAHLDTFHVESWGLGQAHLREECDDPLVPCDDSESRLIADNLGSSGQDGVAIDLGPGASGAALRSKRCPDCPPGHVTLMKAYDDAAQETLRVTLQSHPGSGTMAPDYLALGSLEFAVAYIGTDGTALAVESWPNGTPLEVPGSAEACPDGTNDNWIFSGSGVLTRRFCTPSGTLTLPSGASVSSVREVRIRPQNPTVPNLGIRRITFTSPFFNPIVIDKVTVSRPTYASGIPHEPLGQLSSMTVQGRKLTACCIGSSGEDGVSLELNSLLGGGGSVDIAPLLGATGMHREIRISATGWNGTIKGHMRIMGDSDGNLSEEYDFSTIGATSLDWRLRNAHGGLLAEGTVPGSVISWTLDGLTSSGEAVDKAFEFTSDSAARSDAATAGQGFFDRPVSVGGLTPVPVAGVHHIEVTPVQPCAGCPNGPPWDDLQSIEVTAEGIPEIALSNAHFKTFDGKTWAVGQAHVAEECTDPLVPCDSSDRRLEVRNLGSSGQDGVSIDLGPRASGGQAARSKRCPDCPPGHVTLIKFTDEGGGETFRMTHTENPLAGHTDLQVDAAGQGAMQTLATFYDAMGVEMGSIVLDSSSVVSYLPDAPYAPDIWSWVGGRYVLRAGVPLRFDTSLGSYLNVDAAVFTPIGPTSPRASSMAVITSNDPSGFVLHSVSATPAAIGDVDRDGDLDLADFSVLNQCLSGPNVSTRPPTCDALHFELADLDRDVDVDLSDFSAFQRAPLGE